MYPIMKETWRDERKKGNYEEAKTSGEGNLLGSKGYREKPRNTMRRNGKSY